MITTKRPGAKCPRQPSEPDVACSLFNIRGNAIAKQIAALRQTIGKFIADHRRACRCAFCRHMPLEATSFMDDAQGLQWALSVAEGCMSSYLIPAVADVQDYLGSAKGGRP